MDQPTETKTKHKGKEALSSLPKPICVVVIPTYNYGDRIARAIKSVKAQTISNISCVIVDDGSTDNTREAVLAEIKDDRRFHYIHQDNAGVAEARNRGVFSEEAGNSVYCACLDADDAMAPQFLEACIKAMESDRAISIAYTGLYYVRPDGQEGLSKWPEQWDYNKQLEGHNQIPTCNVARREVWERLGGQRQRYAPEGAGEEDAEMWLRAGAYGFRAKKVTDAGLFIYSWMSGRVSGNKEHKMVQYMDWHPWTKDRQHPLASCATAEKFSHPVREYDEPSISVIIPVATGHEKVLYSALDSLDAQTFRKWEAVVVWDSSNSPEDILRTFPYIKLVNLGVRNGNAHGAGYARNRGVEKARSSLIMYLDADDWLHPQALEKMLQAYTSTGQIVYTDYVGKAEVEKQLALELRRYDRLLEYNEKTKLALIAYHGLEYECERAMRQPDPKDMYIWCLVTTLMPKAYHYEIGGFDEKMPSWEDWDYNLRLARFGKCFFHLQDRLVCYRFYSGNRREKGMKEYGNLVQYLGEKYSEEKMAGHGCSGGCGGAAARPMAAMSQPRMMQDPTRQVEQLKDEDFVMALYNSANIGQHEVVGASGRHYGFRGGGEKFLVLKSDVELSAGLFIAEFSQPPAVSVDNQLTNLATVEDEAPPESLKSLLEAANEPVAEAQAAFGGEVKEEPPAKLPRTRKPRAARTKR